MKRFDSTSSMAAGLRGAFEDQRQAAKQKREREAEHKAAEQAKQPAKVSGVYVEILCASRRDE